MVTHQLQVERRTAKGHRPKTDALPLDHTTNRGRVYHHAVCNQPTRLTQHCIPPGSLNRVPASDGGKGWNVTSAGWQVTLCNPIWHVSSSSGEACCELLYPVTLLATRRSRVRLPAAVASTGTSDRLRTGKLPRYFTKPLKPTQPPSLRETGNGYQNQPQCGDALQLGSKSRMAHSKNSVIPCQHLAT